MTNLYDIPVRKVDLSDATLAEHKGKVLLVVNVASQCGFTPQYKGLEALYRKHRDAGLVIVGFPCNQFGRQEPGSEEEIKTFCSTKYDVTFPLYAKVEVNGDGAHPLYRALKSARPGILGSEAIKWNFTKFLVNRRGEVIERFAPNATPEELEAPIARALADK